MSFDAGSIIAHMDLDDAEFDRKLREDVARIEAFERRSHDAKISVEMDQSGINRARQQFERFDRQITQDAQRRARSSGSVLGALMGIFGGHGAAGTTSGGSGRSLLGGLLGGAGPVPTGIPVSSRAVLASAGGAVGLGALPGLLGGVLPLGVGLAGVGAAGALFKGASQQITPLLGLQQQIQHGKLTATTPQQLQQLAAQQASLKQALSQLPVAQRQMFTAISGIQNAWQHLTASFAPVLAKGLGAAARVFQQLLPALRQFFSGATTLIGPFIHGLGDIARVVLPLLGQAFRAAAPLMRPLLDGFARLLGGLLPGIIALLHAASPAVHALAGILGELGHGIGIMLRDFAPAVKASSVIFKALGDVLAAIFPIIGKLASIFARDLAPVFVIFAGVIRQLLPYLTIIGRVLGALAGAVLKDLVSLFGSFAHLLVLISPSVRILADALSKMFTVLESSGTFGALSSALEQIVPSLARLINQLVRQLAPELPIIIKAFAAFSTILITLAANGLATILSAVTFLIAHTPRWVFLLGLAAGAFYLLDAAIAANPIGATILAILALVGAATLLAKHWGQVWGDIKNWAMDAWNFLTHGWGQLLIPGLTAVRLAVEFVRDHWKQAWDDIKGAALDAWNFLQNDIWDPLKNLLLNDLPSWWDQAVSAVSNAWNRVENVVKTPVAWVVDHVINGLISAFDWISGKVGGPHIDAVHPFGLATGGRIPGYGGGDRHLALLEGGEAVLSKETTAANAQWLAALGVPGFQGGGVFEAKTGQKAPKGGGGIFGFLDGLFGKIADIGKIMSAVVTGNTTALVNAFRHMIPGGVGGAVGDLAQLLVAVPKTLIEDAVKALIGFGGGGSANSIVQYAMSWLGKIPYVWGGTAVPGGADCSGFVKAVYKHFGIAAPRTSEEQGGWVKRTPPTPGGLAFYHSPAGGPDPGHVAIVGDHGRVISQGGGMGPQLVPLHSFPLLWTGIPPGGFGNSRSAGGPYNLGALEALWTGAGGPGGMTAHIAAAIALAESSGRPKAHNASGASGLWQILGQLTRGNIFDPAINALNAVLKWRGAGDSFSPWVTYEDGAYRRFMDSGGWMGPGTHLLTNATGGREAVLTPRESEAHVMLARAADHLMRSGSSGTDTLAKQLDRLIAAVQRAPGLTGAALASALDAGSSQAAYRAQYSAR